MPTSPSERRRVLLVAALALSAILAAPAASAQSAPAQPHAASPPPPPPDAPSPAEIPPSDPLAPPLLTQRALGLAVGGVGAIGIVVGAALGVTAVIKKGESNSSGHCLPDNVCDRMGVELRNASLDYGNWSTAMFIAGGALLTGGIVLIATAPVAPPAPRTGAPFTANLSLRLGIIQLSGTW